MKRKGMLLAISSLPGKYGVGDFSKPVFSFIKILAKSKLNFWVILPLNPIGYGHSPYQPFSSYAFDEIYISLEDLKSEGLLKKVKAIPQKRRSDFEIARSIKVKAIEDAFNIFNKSENNRKKLDKFLKENPYVDEFCEFITIKEFNNHQSWDKWNIKKEDRIDEFSYNKLKHGFAQMKLHEQWKKIRNFANQNGIMIMGDIPFYVGYDSSDVYFHRECYYLDKKWQPTCIAGVPPDFFSEDGQRWGNPIWNWEWQYTHKFKTLIDRIHYASTFYDILRIDHFRAFDSYWAIDPSCPTAKVGEWRYPKGKEFFEELFKQYPKIKIVVEDLGGDLRPSVFTLRDHFKFPGMREVEFTIFDDVINNCLFEKENQLYYSSTHDNETLNEWTHNLKRSDYLKLNKKMDELKFKGKNLVEKLIHYCLQRKENFIIINASDILNVSGKYRMNIPGTINETNWTFKLTSLTKLESKLRRILDEN